MELTPKVLTEVEFREQWRGYSPHDVDDFLERVALAVGELQDRLRHAVERAEQAERRLLERGAEGDEIQQALLLAQRAAAAALEEAQQRAAQIVAEAEQTAATQAQAEVGELQARREALEAEVRALTERLEQRRRAYRTELERELAFLAGEPQPEPEHEPEPVVAAFEDEVAQAREELVEALRRAGVDQLLAAAPLEEQHPHPQPEPEPEPEPVAIGEPEDDPFLAELRRAVTDDEPLGPRSEDHLAGDHGDEPFPTSRFRLRRGR